MAKGCRTPIPNSAKLRTTEKLAIVYVYLSGPKRTPSLSGARYVILVKDEYFRHAWVCFLKLKSDSGNAFRKFSADARDDEVPSKVAIVRSNNCLLYTSPSPRDATLSRMPSSA